ncbi:hypothetical protein ACFQU1_06905 [Chelatococcus sp. GCM10030263]|uniref:hypothetical protein n=1 Tax=Chelatococcus sp. GCM10030263 TaxID=3273387 RepID=UPI003617E2F4
MKKLLLAAAFIVAGTFTASAQPAPGWHRGPPPHSRGYDHPPRRWHGAPPRARHYAPPRRYVGHHRCWTRMTPYGPRRVCR